MNTASRMESGGFGKQAYFLLSYDKFLYLCCRLGYIYIYREREREYKVRKETKVVVTQSFM